MDWNQWIHADLSGITGSDRIRIAPYSKRRDSAHTYEFSFNVYPEISTWGRAQVSARTAAEARAHLLHSADFAQWCATTDGAREKASTPAISGNLLDLVK